MHGCTQDLHIISCIFEKLGLFFKVTIPSKPEFYQMNQGKSLQNWHINLPKTLPKCQKRKGQKRQVFGPKMVNRLRHQSTNSTGQGIGRLVRSSWLRGVKNTLSIPVAFPSRSRDLPSQLMSNQGSVEGNGHLPSILNASTASESVDPQLDRLRLLFSFLSSRGQKPINRELHFIYE